MGIFLNDAFLSIVDKDGDGTTLLVRARRKGDIERVFPDQHSHNGAGRTSQLAKFSGDESKLEKMKCEKGFKLLG
jgi:hypothetical protein